MVSIDRQPVYPPKTSAFAFNVGFEFRCRYETYASAKLGTGIATLFECWQSMATTMNCALPLMVTFPLSHGVHRPSAPFYPPKTSAFAFNVGFEFRCRQKTYVSAKLGTGIATLFECWQSMVTTMNCALPLMVTFPPLSWCPSTVSPFNYP